MPAESFPLLVTMFFVPGVPKLAPIEFPLGQPVVIDEVAGKGRPFRRGSQVTFHYVVTNAVGKVIASSEVRGIGYTVSFGDLTNPGPWLNCLAGVRAGGIRRFLLPWHELATVGRGIASSFDEVTVRVKVLSVGPSAGQR